MKITTLVIITMMAPLGRAWKHTGYAETYTHTIRR